MNSFKFRLDNVLLIRRAVFLIDAAHDILTVYPLLKIRELPKAPERASRG